MTIKTEISLDYYGQIINARKFLVDKGIATSEEVALMPDERIAHDINKRYFSFTTANDGQICLLAIEHVGLLSTLER
jgi:hypothetical protein